MTVQASPPAPPPPGTAPRRAISILCLDGGGIRGIIPALVLDAIERHTRRPIADLFDLVAGTSTGGILALGLVKPGPEGRPEFSARELLGLYTEHGREIFDKTSIQLWRSADGFLDQRYSHDALERLLKEQFGEAMLSQALRDFVVPAYDLSLPGPFFFKRSDARQPGWDLPFWQAARATSAAPTYFEPLPIPPFPDDVTRNVHALVDGGVYANNPGLCAYAEAIDRFSPAADPPPDIHVVSIGTGTAPERPGRSGGPIPYDDARKWGLARWAVPMLHVVFDGVAKTVDHQLKLLCRDLDASNRPRYHRIQGVLAAASAEMDDASPENLEGLLADGRRILAEQETRLAQACDMLLSIAAERDAVGPPP